MTQKELSQLYYLNQEIERDQERLDELRRKSIGLSGGELTGVPSGNRFESQVERYVAEIVDLEAIISAKITQCLHERSRLERFIADIPDSLIRQILTLRFIDGFSWRGVAERIGGNNTEDSVRMSCKRFLDSNNSCSFCSSKM